MRLLIYIGICNKYIFTILKQQFQQSSRVNIFFKKYYICLESTHTLIISSLLL
jgi:hypothetical protein